MALERDTPVDFADMIGSPGATTSGLFLPSAVGPRLENAERSLVTEPLQPGELMSDWSYVFPSSPVHSLVLAPVGLGGM